MLGQRDCKSIACARASKRSRDDNKWLGQCKQAVYPRCHHGAPFHPPEPLTAATLSDSLVQPQSSAPTRCPPMFSRRICLRELEIPRAFFWCEKSTREISDDKDERGCGLALNGTQVQSCLWAEGYMLEFPDPEKAEGHDDT